MCTLWVVLSCTELFGERPLWPTLSVHQIMYKVGVEGLYPPVEHLPVAVKSIVNMCFTSAVHLIIYHLSVHHVLNISVIYDIVMPFFL